MHPQNPAPGKNNQRNGHDKNAPARALRHEGQIQDDVTFILANDSVIFMAERGSVDVN